MFKYCNTAPRDFVTLYRYLNIHEHRRHRDAHGKEREEREGNRGGEITFCTIIVKG